MQTQEVERVVRAAHDARRARFLGVFPRDMIPDTTDCGNCFYIANTDPSGAPGEHWVAFYVENGEREFFDSYGQSPTVYGFDGTARRVLTHPVQALDSCACGHHCIHYVVSRSHGMSAHCVLSRYAGNTLRQNDSYVHHFVLRLLRQANTVHVHSVPCRQGCCMRQLCTVKHAE